MMDFPGSRIFPEVIFWGIRKNKMNNGEIMSRLLTVLDVTCSSGYWS